MRRPGLIQLSSPVQGPSPPQESNVVQGNNGKVAGNSPVFARAQKKNRPGVFAKLLEGLTVKLKTGATGSVNAETGKVSPNGVKNSTQRVASNAKKGLNFPFSTEFSGGEALDAGFLAAFRQDIRPEQLEALQAESEDLFPAQMGKKSLIPWEDSLREIHLKDDFPNLSAIRSSRSIVNEAGEQPSDLDTSGNRPAKTGLEQPGLPEDKAKNARNVDFRDSAFREMKAEIPQTQVSLAKATLDSGQILQGTEAEAPKYSESRGKRGRDRLSSTNFPLEVRDLRTGEGKISTLAENGAGLREAGTLNSRLQNVEIEIPVDVNLHEGKGEGVGTMAGRAGDSTVTAFEDVLAAQLRGNLSTDIVRNAAVIVRNGGEGTIRLSLRPASLGDVKIRLEMTENKITGHIILQSNEALRAFERELPVLEKAFRDSGFSETNLQMYLAQDGGNYGGQKQDQEGDFLNHVMAAALYEAESGWSGLEALSDSGEPNSGGMGLPFSPGRTPVNLFV